jgi:hypothetical protein
MTEDQAFSALSLRLGEAREKHPTFARDMFEAYEVIADEVLELRHAIGGETRQRQIDEALDVAATCIRFILGEHRNGGIDAY